MNFTYCASRNKDSKVVFQNEKNTEFYVIVCSLIFMKVD